MAEITMHCCECLEPMSAVEYPFARSGECWYLCDTHGFWEESEVGAVVFTLSAYETLVRDGAPMLPVVGDVT